METERTTMETSADILGGLLDTYHSLQLQLRDVRRDIEMACLKHDIQQLDYNGMRLTFKSTVSYDPLVLAGLGEFFSPEEIERLKNKQPERTWNKTQLNKLVKQGGAIGTIIGQAQQESSPSLSIRLPSQIGD